MITLIILIIFFRQRQPSRSCAMSCLAGNHFNAHVFLKNVIPVDRVRTHLELKDIDPE